MTTIDIPAETIRERIDNKPVKLPDGAFKCPVCPRTFDKAQAVGPHKLSHMRAIGMAPGRSKRPLADRRVSCPRCTKRLKYHSMRSHLRGVHEMSLAEVGEVMVDVAASLNGVQSPSTAVAVVEGAETPHDAPEPVERHQPSIGVDDAIVGVLLGLSGGDTVRIVDVPEIATWVQHTRHVARLVNPDD